MDPEYSKHAQGLAQILFGLLSEALGLNPSHLIDVGCIEGHAFGRQYYPPCPEPDRTLGRAKHCDPDFLTILLQDQIRALQVLHEGHWIDIPPPADGGLIVNIGDLLQGCTLISYCYYGIPQDVMNKVIAGVGRFHDEPKEVKMKFYARENEKKVRFVSNYDLYSSKAANWRDSLFCVMAPNPPPPQEYPSACR
ncbi:hypothetical protein PTKIN_Ptkin01aG0355500 [Pterospermum kingtungense]